MTRSVYNHVLVLVIFSTCLSSIIAYDFYVGGRHGWNPNPSETFNNWAERSRFQVNDKLVFDYEKHGDSVLEVSKEDYDACNTTNPFLKLEGGRSKFDLYRSGPFYFISGNYTRCAKDGEKLILVVMAIRNKHKHNSPSSHPISPDAAPVPSLAPAQGAESPTLSEDDKSPHEKVHSSSTKLDLGLGLFVGVLALGLSGGF